MHEEDRIVRPSAWDRPMQDEGDLHSFDELTTGQKARALACMTIIAWIALAAVGIVIYRVFIRA